MSGFSEPISDLHSDPAFALPFRVRPARMARPRRLLILLHGVRNNEMDMAPLAVQVDADVQVVLVRSRLTMGAEKFGYFNFRMTADGPLPVAAEVEASRLCVLRQVAQLQAFYDIGPDRTVIAGFSQGGIMSSCIALTAPQQVAGFGILSGRILPEIEALIAAPARLARQRAFVGHGDNDLVLPPHYALRSQRMLTELGVPHAYHIYPMGHVLGADMQVDFLAWLDALFARH